ncbi:hypothetical protein BV25DRAFT_1836826 [Artomyces pyxidatus]|uniref:Uncharacterized protein n=1 Tax=Artomyces pyxidatus TaxID=48021 RepID=A0ACB8T872_9AGAM|nr:hypothetical protein BV25DRAFT_1836826 [Artomyces pyxidatus]
MDEGQLIAVEKVDTEEEEEDENADLRASHERARFVFRIWPRDPKGPVIIATPRGKEAGNGLPLWGSSLEDFFYVNRIADCPNALTISTGSKLAAWARHVRELKAAKDQIEWADSEDEPVELHPCDISKLIETIEMRANMGCGFGKSARNIPGQRNQSATSSHLTVLKRVLRDVAGMLTPLHKKPKSIFDPSSYPSPWPLVPFSSPAPLLQQRLPYHLLPKKLIVHDPDNTLFVEDEYDYYYGVRQPIIREPSNPAQPRPDVLRTYNLQLTADGMATAYADHADAAKDAGMNKSEMFMLSEAGEDGMAPVIVRVKIPPRPSIDSVPEAHLYLSAAQALGTGHHSLVYKAELEVPRSLLVPWTLCQRCLTESVESEVAKLRDQDNTSHRWKTERSHGNAEEGNPDFEDVGIPEIIKKVMSLGISPTSQAGLSSQADSAGGQNASENTASRSRHTTLVAGYEGPIYEVTAKVEWQGFGRPVCEHRAERRGKVPPTATVRLAVKLSIEDDPQLHREAMNYQRFPKHLFQHWSGYNVVRPINDPVPVGAVVPQFYGYYVPALAKKGKDKQYLSPILLMEDCGRAIDPTTLSLDDRQECASLLFRLHHAGFKHNSPFQRNIVMQLGDLQDFPLEKRISDRRFRLIDFGRSEEAAADEGRFLDEENRIVRELSVLYAAMIPSDCP